MLQSLWDVFMKLHAASKIALILTVTAFVGCASSHSSLAKNSSAAQQANARFPDLSEKFNNVKKAPDGNSYYYFVLAKLSAFEGNSEGALYLIDKAIEQDKSSSFLEEVKARESVDANRIELALTAAQRSVDLNPKNQEALLLLGKLYSAKRMTNEAMAQYQEVLKLNPKSEDAYISIAREYMMRKETDLAIATITRMKRAIPDSYAGDYYLGTLYSTFKKDYPKALLVFKQILQENPEDSRSLQALGQIYLEMNDLPEALKVYKALEKQTPEDIATQLRLGLLLYEMKSFGEAQERFQKILDANPNSDRIQYYLGVVNQVQKNDPAALEYFKQVVPESSFYKEAVVRAVIILESQNKIQEALDLAQVAAQKRPDITEFYDVVASLLTSMDNHQKAIESLKEAITQYPRDEKLYFALGVAYDKQGDTENAIKSMKKVLEIDSEHAPALNYIGYTYADQGVKLEEATAMLVKAVQLRPKDGYIADSLGWAYFKKGELNKAVYYLLKADELSPGEASILEHLGDAFAKKGSSKKAEIYYQKAAEALEAQNKKTKKDVEDLARVKKKLFEKVGMKY